jgi:very-short-patch-repair endonuclease
VGPLPGEQQAWPDRAIAGIAARQATMVSHEQLRSLGVAARTVSEALERGRVHPVHRGVYSLVPPQARPPHGAEWAALLACGTDAVLSHRTAAQLHGLPVAVGPLVEVTVRSGGRGRTRSGLRVHRTTTIGRLDLVRIGSLLVTSVPRTVVDLACELDDGALERLLDRALTRTSRTRILEILDAHPRRGGAGRLRSLLDPERPSADTWSVAEARLLGLIRRAGLPMPEANVRIGDYVPDLLWREQRLIVEFDSWTFHGGPRAFGRDRERHNTLLAHGFQVLHVTWHQLTREPEKVLVWIATALARSGG